MGRLTEALTAEQARDMANTSTYTVDHIYKAIQEQAHCNQTALVWDICDISTVALDDILANLSSKGFSVEADEAQKFIKISW